MLERGVVFPDCASSGGVEPVIIILVTPVSRRARGLPHPAQLPGAWQLVNRRGHTFRRKIKSNIPPLGILVLNH